MATVFTSSQQDTHYSTLYISFSPLEHVQYPIVIKDVAMQEVREARVFR